MASLIGNGGNGSDHKLPTVDISERSPIPRWAADDRHQEDYNLAQFCLYQDIEQIEDYLFLELVRYALDQQNSDTLPYLANTAIDMVIKMVHSNETSMKDAKKCRREFMKHVVESSPETINKTPLMRMQDTIAKHMAMNEAQKRAAKERGLVLVEREYPDFHTECRDLEYFGATVDQQKLVEQSFVAAIWNADIPSEPSGAKPLFMDMASQIIQVATNYTHPLPDRYKLASVDMATAFVLRLNLLAVMVLGENRSIAFDAVRKTASAEAKQPKKWANFKHTLAPHGRTRDIPPNLVQSLAQLSKDKQHELEILNNKLLPLAQLNPFFCCLNNHHARMFTAIDSVQVMDESFVVQILGHLWNLLREEQYLTSVWLDLDFLIGALGVHFVFQGERPTIEGGKEALEKRIWYFVRAEEERS